MEISRCVTKRSNANSDFLYSWVIYWNEIYEWRRINENIIHICYCTPMKRFTLWQESFLWLPRHSRVLSFESDSQQRTLFVRTIPLKTSCKHIYCICFELVYLVIIPIHIIIILIIMLVCTSWCFHYHSGRKTEVVNMCVCGNHRWNQYEIKECNCSWTFQESTRTFCCRSSVRVHRNICAVHCSQCRTVQHSGGSAS